MTSPGDPGHDASRAQERDFVCPLSFDFYEHRILSRTTTEVYDDGFFAMTELKRTPAEH
jgi:hypothetical protein